MNQDMASGVLRQRRNLIILCAVLGFYKIAGVDLGSASSLVNATPISISIGIKNISAIYWGLLGLTVYFWIRYVQYYFAYVYPGTAIYIKNIYYRMVEKILIKEGLLKIDEVSSLRACSDVIRVAKIKKSLMEESRLKSRERVWVLKTLVKFIIFDPYILNYWLPLILPVPVIILFLA